MPQSRVQVSRGDHGVWPDLDRGGSDDMALIWFDPEATGEDEVGNEGTGITNTLEGETVFIEAMPGPKTKALLNAALRLTAKSRYCFTQERRAQNWCPAAWASAWASCGR